MKDASASQSCMPVRFADPCSVTWSLPGVGLRARLDRQHVESDGSDAQ